MVLFADDTNLLITKKDESDLQHKIINIMKGLEIWFQKNNLIINSEKAIAFISFKTYDIFSKTVDNL
jgi:dsDNA-binding SOS-regulon protein